MDTNKDYMQQSLVNQIADYTIRLAERDSIITEQQQQIQELQKEIEDYRKKEIEEMNNDAE